MKSEITQEDLFKLERAVLTSINAETLLQLATRGPIIYGFALYQNDD